MQAELASKQAQIDRTKTNVDLIRKMVAVFNPENLTTAVWTDTMKQKLATLRDLTQAHSELQKVPFCLYCFALKCHYPNSNLFSFTIS